MNATPAPSSPATTAPLGPAARLWAQANIYLLTAAGLAVAVFMALTWTSMPIGQKALGFFCIGIVLHEWEELRFPGGFHDLMFKKLRIDPVPPRERIGLSHGVVAIAIAFFAFLPFALWQHVAWLAGIPAILGIFEAFIHVAGIKIHQLRHPYTPGMATSLLCLLPSSIAIIVFAMAGVSVGDWLLAGLCYLVIFATMQVGVVRTIGIDPKTMPVRIKAIRGR